MFAGWGIKGRGYPRGAGLDGRTRQRAGSQRVVARVGENRHSKSDFS
jgi:hypothetical protein